MIVLLNLPNINKLTIGQRMFTVVGPNDLYLSVKEKGERLEMVKIADKTTSNENQHSNAYQLCLISLHDIPFSLWITILGPKSSLQSTTLYLDFYGPHLIPIHIKQSV